MPPSSPVNPDLCSVLLFRFIVLVKTRFGSPFGFLGGLVWRAGAASVSLQSKPRRGFLTRQVAGTRVRCVALLAGSARVRCSPTALARASGSAHSPPPPPHPSWCLGTNKSFPFLMQDQGRKQAGSWLRTLTGAQLAQGQVSPEPAKGSSFLPACTKEIAAPRSSWNQTISR